MNNGTSRRGLRVLGIVAVVGALLSTGATPAGAAPAVKYSLGALSATVSGTSVVVTGTIKASRSVTAASAGICARTAKGAKADFTKGTNVVLTPGGATFRRSAKLPVGSYSYFACIKVGGVWKTVGATKSFKVSKPVSAVRRSVSSTVMPVGNLPHWRQVFADDFSTPVSLGSFPGALKGKWKSYDGFADTFKDGVYNQNIISVHGGMLDLYLHSAGGKAQVAAPIPLINGKWGGHTYGKFTVRFRSDAVAGYKTAWLLWPDSNNWNEGEVDFPEAGLNSPISGFSHCVGKPTSNCAAFTTTARYTSWHTASIEWTPGRLVFIMDGQTVNVTTSNVPRTPMHWVLQTESSSSKPNLTSAGHLQIDWVSEYTYAG